MRCAECGREYDGFDFCPYCGAYPRPAGQEAQPSPGIPAETPVQEYPGYPGVPYESSTGVTPLTSGQRIAVELLCMTLALLLCLIGGATFSLLVGMTVVLIASYYFQRKPLERNPVPQMVDGGLWGLMIGLLYEIFYLTG